MSLDIVRTLVDPSLTQEYGIKWGDARMSSGKTQSGWPQFEKKSLFTRSFSWPSRYAFVPNRIHRLDCTWSYFEMTLNWLWYPHRRQCRFYCVSAGKTRNQVYTYRDDLICDVWLWDSFIANSLRYGRALIFGIIQWLILKLLTWVLCDWSDYSVLTSLNHNKAARSTLYAYLYNLLGY